MLVAPLTTVIGTGSVAPIFVFSSLLVATWMSGASAGPLPAALPMPAAGHGNVLAAQTTRRSRPSGMEPVTSAPPFGEPHQSLGKGKFLVAAPQLRDPNFAKTVVLLLDYNPNGALGLIINRPTNIALSTVLPEMVELRDRRDTVYLGGPVARDRMVLLVRSKVQPLGTGEVIAEVFVSASLDTLRGLLEAPGDPGTFHAYVGYAGWAPGQLDSEVSRGDWHITIADADTVFDKDASQIWPEMIEKNAGTWVQAPAWLQNSVAR